MTKLRRRALLLLVLWAASAAAGNPPEKLDFDSRRFTVMYHSCGCADLCWVAEVTDQKAKAVRYKLRCTCEELLFEDLKAGTSLKQPETCAEAQDKKFELIPARLKALLPKG